MTVDGKIEKRQKNSSKPGVSRASPRRWFYTVLKPLLSAVKDGTASVRISFAQSPLRTIYFALSADLRAIGIY